MWKRVDVVFKLITPLHIGYLPFRGSVVSPTRYYVPGRTLWGAITKRITEYLCEKPGAEDYRKTGEQVMENFRFSYFYIYDGRTIYFPRYTDEGLKFGNGEKEEITKSEFEHRFIGSLISTALDSNGTAKDASLHEIEFINNRFKDENGNVRNLRIAGRVYVKKDKGICNKNVEINNRGIFVDDFNILQELTLGGESKYGFGHVIQDPSKGPEIPIKVKEENGKEILYVEMERNRPILGHLKYNRSIGFIGELELLSGRGYFYPEKPDERSDNPGGVILKPEYYFSPGTTLLTPQNDIAKKIKLCYDGRMMAI